MKRKTVHKKLVAPVISIINHSNRLDLKYWDDQCSSIKEDSLFCVNCHSKINEDNSEAIYDFSSSLSFCNKDKCFEEYCIKLWNNGFSYFELYHKEYLRSLKEYNLKVSGITEGGFGYLFTIIIKETIRIFLEIVAAIIIGLIIGVVYQLAGAWVLVIFIPLYILMFAGIFTIFSRNI